MDKKIIEKLQEHAMNYKAYYANFPYKNDIEAVFAMELQEYLAPLINDILPFIAQRLFAFPNESIEDYLPFILQHYHEKVIKELINLESDMSQLYKKQSNIIEKSFMKHILHYQSKPINIKNLFIIDFVQHNIVTIRTISEKSPEIGLELIAKLRNPKVQQLLIKDDDIFTNISTFIKSDLVNQPWDTWVDKLFTYPRTKDLNEYLNKWISRDKLHIKTCSNLFEREHYEQLKIWLKGQEKKSEKRAYEKKIEQDNYEQSLLDNVNNDDDE